MVVLILDSFEVDIVLCTMPPRDVGACEFNILVQSFSYIVPKDKLIDD